MSDSSSFPSTILLYFTLWLLQNSVIIPDDTVICIDSLSSLFYYKLFEMQGKFILLFPIAFIKVSCIESSHKYMFSCIKLFSWNWQRKVGMGHSLYTPMGLFKKIHIHTHYT